MNLYQLTVTCVIFQLFYSVSRSSNISYMFTCSYVLLLSYILIFPQPGLPLGLLLFAYNFVNSVRGTGTPHIPPNAQPTTQIRKAHSKCQSEKEKKKKKKKGGKNRESPRETPRETP